MAELIEIGEQQERVILFAASTNDSDDTEESVEELKELVKTAGAETVGTVIHTRISTCSRQTSYRCFSIAGAKVGIFFEYAIPS